MKINSNPKFYHKAISKQVDKSLIVTNTFKILMNDSNLYESVYIKLT